MWASFILWLAIAAWVRYMLYYPGIHYEWRGALGWVLAALWPLVVLLLAFKYIVTQIRG